MYEGSTECDVGGRDHFGAGGDFGGWVPDNYDPGGHKEAVKKMEDPRPMTPSSRFARGEKVTPFHVRRTIRGSDGAPIGRESWDTIKHLPGLVNTSTKFKPVGTSDLIKGRFGEGFQRRRQSDIRQDEARLSQEAAKEIKVGNCAAVRKKFISVHANRNTYNPITGDYWGKPHNGAFQDMVTSSAGAMYQDRYAHHVKRALPGPKANGECSDIKPISAYKTSIIAREGMSHKKAAMRGSVKNLFSGHDGYVLPKMATLPPRPQGLHKLA